MILNFLQSLRHLMLIFALEINAASTITALTLSSLFDLKRTYFFIAGIAGVSPKVATIGVSSSNVRSLLSLTIKSL